MPCVLNPVANLHRGSIVPLSSRRVYVEGGADNVVISLSHRCPPVFLFDLLNELSKVGLYSGLAKIAFVPTNAKPALRAFFATLEEAIASERSVRNNRAIAEVMLSDSGVVRIKAVRELREGE